MLALFVLLEWLSFIHEYKGLPITPWNPGLGVVFALMIRNGPAAGLLLFFGIIVAEASVLRSALGWPLILVIAAAATLSYTLVAMAARRLLRLDAALMHMRDILILLAAGLCGALLAAALLTGLLILFGRLETPDLLEASIPLLVGDVIGIAVITPLLLRLAAPGRWMERPLAARGWQRLAEGLFYAVLIAGSLWALVSLEQAGGLRLFYLLFLPVVAAAVRFGLDGACLALAAAQFGLVLVLERLGYDARAFTEFQALLFVLTAAGLIVGMAVNERRLADQAKLAAEARLREQEAQMAQAARLTLASGMASALAHEISQPLTAARALARSVQAILQGPGSDLERAGGNLATLIGQIDHAGDVVRRMREFIRRGRPHISTLSAREILEEAATLARTGNARIRIEFDIPSDLPLLHGDRVQLQQVAINLIHNAMDSIAADDQTNGLIRIVARHATEPSRIEIAISDNGPGMPPERAARLFMPLASAKTEGLGLGLAISAMIVEAHGGRIWLQSSAPGHTEFRFHLPLETT